MGFQAVSAGYNSSLILFWSPWMSLYFIYFSCPIDFRHFLVSNPEALSWRTTKAGCGMPSLDRIGRSDKRISLARGVGTIIENVLGFLHRPIFTKASIHFVPLIKPILESLNLSMYV
jgi:hypothetical protein